MRHAGGSNDFDRQPDVLMESNGHGEFAAKLVVVYRETIRPFYAYIARRSGGSRELAEDVTQETYLRAAAVWPVDGIPRIPLAWLQTVGRRLLVSYFRSRRVDAIDPNRLDQMHADSSGDAVEIHDAVCWALAQLSARQSRLFEAFHLDGKSIATIATEQGLTERAVEGRIRRARERLKRILSRHGT
jgi:RNA polymerase sigma-70 factor, ECF subfamily